jgi:phage gp29-like protein
VAVKNAFNNIHNDSVIVLPGKKDQMVTVDPVTVQSNAADFIAAIDRCDRGIMRALLIPSLMFLNGDGTGSFALGQEHAKTFEKILDGMLIGLKQTLIDQHVSRMIRLNFPRSAWEKDGFGDFSKRDFSQEEIQHQLDAMEKAVNMGAADMNDLADMNKVREMLGLSERSEPISSGLFDELTPEETLNPTPEVDDVQVPEEA